MAGLIYQVISGVLAAVILFGALSIVLISWKNGITPMPSSAYARRVVTRELKQIGTRGNLVEAGSGWGHLALEIGAHCSGWSIVGIENSQIPLGVSQLAARLRRLRNVRFLRGDLYTFPYEDVDVVVCYLFPGAMTRLSKLLRTRLSPGAKVISVCFALPGWTPERIITCRDTYQTKIYVYADSEHYSQGCLFIKIGGDEGEYCNCSHSHSCCSLGSRLCRHGTVSPLWGEA